MQRVLVATVLALILTCPARADFIIGQNFTGTSYTGFVPPDTDGSIGPNNRFVELLNGSFAVYNTSTGTVVGSQITQDRFWSNAGVSVTNSSDPHVIYDAQSGHWFAVAIDTLSSNNHALIAVSNTSDPTGTWKGFSLTEGNGRLNDFPMVGMNKDALTVGFNDFNGTTGDRVSMLVVNKSQLISGSISVGNGATYLSNTSPSIDPNTTGFSAHPVLDLSNGTGTNSVLSAFSDNPGNLKLSTITNTNTSTPGLNTTSGTNQGFIAVPAVTAPSNAHQPNGNNTIDTGDTRFSANVIKVGSWIWAVQTIQNGNYNALQWFRIDPSTQTVKESGLISAPNRDYYYGSIAVNSSGNIVIGFSGSSDLTTTGFSGNPSAFAVVGNFDGTTTTFGTPVLLKDGTSSYDNTAGGQTTNRWGDYSQTTIDPNNPNAFWTVQEWASGSSTWSTQITEILISATPEPGSLTLVGLAATGAAGYYWRRRKAPAAAVAEGSA